MLYLRYFAFGKNLGRGQNEYHTRFVTPSIEIYQMSQGKLSLGKLVWVCQMQHFTFLIVSQIIKGSEEYFVKRISRRSVIMFLVRLVT